jgi:hypothetical protein
MLCNDIFEQRITAVEALQHPFFHVKLPQHIDMLELQARMQKEENKEVKEGEATSGSRQLGYEMAEPEKDIGNVSFSSKKAMSLLERARYKPNVRPSTLITKNA